MSTVLKTAASLGSEKAKRSVEAMEEGAKAGLMKGLMNIPLDSYRDKIHKQLIDIKKLILQESPLIDNEKSQLDNLAAIDEDIQKYMFTELQKNLFKIQAKYPKLSLGTQEDIDNLVNDLSVPKETKQQILFEYYKIADEIINGSFVTYVENKYEVNIKSLDKDNTN